MIFSAQSAFAGSLLIGCCDGVKRGSRLRRAQINLHTNGSPVQAGCSITALTHAVITEQQAPGQALVWSTGLVLRPPPTPHVSPGQIRAQRCEPPHYEQPQWPPGSCHPHNNTPAAQTMSLTFTAGRHTHTTTTTATSQRSRGLLETNTLILTSISARHISHKC